MGVRDELDTTDAPTRTDENNDGDRAERLEGAADPFSFAYETERWSVDDKTVDRGLSLLLAVTNLL